MKKRSLAAPVGPWEPRAAVAEKGAAAEAAEEVVASLAGQFLQVLGLFSDEKLDAFYYLDGRGQMILGVENLC